MYFPTITIVSALAATATADYLTMQNNCFQGRQCNPKAVWHTDFLSKGVNAGDGCRRNYIPNIYRECYDWTNRRGHFLAVNQNKRCLRETSYRNDVCMNGYVCHYHVWTEVPCAWREANVRGEIEGRGEQNSTEAATEAVPFEA